MSIIKKLTFAPFFLISFFGFVFLLSRLPISLELFFSLDKLTFLIWLVVLAWASGLFLVLFITFSQDPRLMIGLSLISTLAFFYFFTPPSSIILSVGYLGLAAFSYLVVINKLKTYLEFRPASFLSPDIRNFATVLLLLGSLSFLFNLDKSIQQKGIEIPDSLVNLALQFSPTQSANSGLDQATLNQLSQQTNLLKQLGLNPQDLNSRLKQTIQPADDLFKKTIKDQLTSLLGQYQTILAPILAGLLFLSMLSLVSIVTWLNFTILWLIFWVLEATNFAQFKTETREVKKLVV